MKILELSIKSYGMFENFKLNFQDGINLIYGLNESGKSTIHSFIKEVFYGFTKPNLRINKFSTDYERYKPWNKNVFSGSVIIEKDSVKYIIERDFLNREYKISDFNTGENIGLKLKGYSASNLKFPGQFFFGVDSDFFEDTAFISQKKFEFKDSSEICAKILTTGDGNDEVAYTDAIKCLQQKLDAIGSKRAYSKNYAILSAEVENLKNRKYDLEKETTKYLSYLKSIETDNAEFKNLISIREQLEDQIKQADLNEISEKYKEKLRLKKELEELESNIPSEYKHLNISIEDKNFVLEKLQNIFSRRESIKFLKENLHQLEEGVKEKEDMVKNQILLSKYEDAIEKIKKINISKKIFYMSSASSTALGILGGLVFKNLYVTIFSILFFTFSLFIYLKKENKNKTQNILSGFKVESLEEIERDYFELKSFLFNKQRIELLEDEKKNQIASYKGQIEKLENQNVLEENGIRLIFDDYDLDFNVIGDSFFEKIQNTLNVLEKIKYIKNLINILDKQYKFKNYNENALLNNIKVNESVMVMKNKHSEVQNRILELNNKIVAEKEKVKFLEIKVSDLRLLSEELKYKEELLLKLDEEKNVINLAIKNIKDSVNEVHGDLIPKLNTVLKENIFKISNGKYNNIRIDKDFNIFIEDEFNKTVPIENLSSGTMDLIVILVRITLVDFILGENFPIFFDDSFVQIDNDRLKRFLSYISEKEIFKRQIFIFTCQDREIKYFEEGSMNVKYNLINLEAI